MMYFFYKRVIYKYIVHNPIHHGRNYAFYGFCNPFFLIHISLTVKRQIYKNYLEVFGDVDLLRCLTTLADKIGTYGKINSKVAICNLPNQFEAMSVILMSKQN